MLTIQEFLTERAKEVFADNPKNVIKTLMDTGEVRVYLSSNGSLMDESLWLSLDKDVDGWVGTVSSSAQFRPNDIISEFGPEKSKQKVAKNMVTSAIG
jgi:hypothetical protein